jgi:hypothetical protein
VPPSDGRRGDLECHASFNKLLLELVEGAHAMMALKELNCPLTPLDFTNDQQLVVPDDSPVTFTMV